MVTREQRILGLVSHHEVDILVFQCNALSNKVVKLLKAVYIVQVHTLHAFITVSRFHWTFACLFVCSCLLNQSAEVFTPMSRRPTAAFGLVIYQPVNHKAQRTRGQFEKKGLIKSPHARSQIVWLYFIMILFIYISPSQIHV